MGFKGCGFRVLCVCVCVFVCVFVCVCGGFLEVGRPYLRGSLIM